MTGAIFCGGKSFRMGQPKEAMILKSGIPMIEHIYNTLSIFCTRIVLVGNSSNLPTSLKNLEQVKDNYRDIGPMGGLEALLSSNIDDEYLIVPCDLDQINNEALKILVEADGNLPIVLRKSNQLEPLIGRYPIHTLPIIREKIKRKLYSLKAVLSDMEHTEVAVPEKLNFALNNVNTVHDFK